MRILITGGAGFIGTKITERLLGQEEKSDIVIYYYIVSVYIKM